MTEPRPAFNPTTSGHSDGSGPPWTNGLPGKSLARIKAASTLEEAHVQATTEVVVLLHSIRRILLWTAVIIPVIALIFGLTWGIAAAQSGEVDCPTYSSRC